MYFNGLIFTIPSTLLVTLVRYLYINFIFVTLLMNHLLTEQMRHSNNSRYHGAREKRYFHFISWPALCRFNDFSLNFLPFSETINFGIPCCVIYLLRLCKYVAVYWYAKCLSRSSLTLHKFIYIYNFW